VLGAERGDTLLVAAFHEDSLDRERCPQRGDVRRRLPAVPDHAEGRRTVAREVLRGDGGRGRRAQLPEQVGFDHRLEAGVLDREENDDERRPSGSHVYDLSPA